MSKRCKHKGRVWAKLLYGDMVTWGWDCSKCGMTFGTNSILSALAAGLPDVLR